MLCSETRVSSPPFPKFLLLSLKPKDFVSRNFLTLGFSHLTQFLGKVPHLVFQRGWHWPLDLFDFKMNRNQQKGKKKKLPHVHLTLTYSHSPEAASGLAVWITSGHLIHPQSLSLNSRTNICPVWSKVWGRSSLLFFLKPSRTALPSLWSWFRGHWAPPQTPRLRAGQRQPAWWRGSRALS